MTLWATAHPSSLPGDIRAWMGAVGALATAGTLILGVVLYLRQISDRRQAQARLVAGWEHGVRQGKKWVELVIRVRNASDLPVYQVMANVAVGVRGTFCRQLGTLAPHETREIIIFLPGFPRGFSVEPTLVFSDAAARSWSRGSDGKLRRANDSDWEMVTRQDAGGYNSLDTHPTMYLWPDEFPHRGTTIDW